MLLNLALSLIELDEFGIACLRVLLGEFPVSTAVLHFADHSVLVVEVACYATTNKH